MQIKLERIQKGDLEKLRKWRMSESVTKYMKTDPTITPKQQLEWYEKVKGDINAFYWIIKCDERRIGFFSITNIDRNHESCEIGHYIGEEEYRNRGIGKTIEANICEYVFEVLKLKTIIFDIFEENIPAYKVHKCFGAVEDRSGRKEIIKNKRKYVMIRLYINYENWQKERNHKEYATIEIQ